MSIEFKLQQTFDSHAEVADYLNDQLNNLEAMLNDGTSTIRVSVSDKVPPKPRKGQIYYADGVNWNPGSGEGLYVFKGAAGWKFLG